MWYIQQFKNQKNKHADALYAYDIFTHGQILTNQIRLIFGPE